MAHFFKRTTKKIKKMEKLLAINSRILATNDFSHLLKNVIQQGKALMECEACSLMLLDKKNNDLYFDELSSEKDEKLKNMRVPLGKGIAGQTALTGEIILVNDVNKDRRFYNKIDKESGFISRSILCVPLKAKNTIIGIIEAINPLNKKSFNKEDINIFSHFSGIAAAAIDKIQTEEKNLIQKRIEYDLDVAHKIQQNFLPPTPTVPGRDNIYAASIPARNIGGDLFDFFPINDKKMCILLGDVSGKGVSAALYMVKLLSDFRAHGNYLHNIESTFQTVNNIFFERNRKSMFATMIFMVYDLEEKSIEYINAGHLPIFIKNNRTNEISTLSDAKCPPLGVFQEIEITSCKRKLLPEETVILITDGIIEATDKNRHDYGIERFVQFIQNHDSDSIGPAILNEILTFTSQEHAQDDITIVTF